MAMIRKQIYIDAATNKSLKAEAKRRKMSEAAIIRERIGGSTAVAESPERAAARARVLARLEQVRAKNKGGSGTGWKFDREEIYAERLEKALPRRHQRTRLRQ